MAGTEGGGPRRRRPRRGRSLLPEQARSRAQAPGRRRRRLRPGRPDDPAQAALRTWRRGGEIAVSAARPSRLRTRRGWRGTWPRAASRSATPCNSTTTVTGSAPSWTARATSCGSAPRLGSSLLLNCRSCSRHTGGLARVGVPLPCVVSSCPTDFVRPGADFTLAGKGIVKWLFPQELPPGQEKHSDVNLRPACADLAGAVQLDGGLLIEPSTLMQSVPEE